MRKNRPKLNQRAFTIVELMIATSVLSTIIILVSVMMISIGNLFYKGINQSRTQDDVRTITDQVSQDLKLNNNSLKISIGSSASGIPIEAYCISNSVRYTAAIGYKIGSGFDIITPPTPARPLLPHVLWRDDGSDNRGADVISGSDPTCNPIKLTNPSLSDPTGTELIAPNSRLTAFTISGSSPSPYDISVGVAYGDIDLLNLIGINSTCRGGAGDQFCSTASLKTTVTTRIIVGS